MKWWQTLNKSEPSLNKVYFGQMMEVINLRFRIKDLSKVGENNL